MDKSDEFLGRMVVARTADGSFHFVGRCISYCYAPTVGIVLPDGTRKHWRADMCQVVDLCGEAVLALVPVKVGP